MKALSKSVNKKYNERLKLKVYKQCNDCSNTKFKITIFISLEHVLGIYEIVV